MVSCKGKKKDCNAKGKWRATENEAYQNKKDKTS
jgi:hypothetical protein